MIVVLCNIENSSDSFSIDGDFQINENGMSCFKQVLTLIITIYPNIVIKNLLLLNIHDKLSLNMIQNIFSDNTQCTY